MPRIALFMLVLVTSLGAQNPLEDDWSDLAPPKERPSWRAEVEAEAESGSGLAGVVGAPEAWVPIPAGRGAPLEDWMVPPWSSARVSRYLVHRAAGRTDTERGAALAAQLEALRPGDHLAIGAGTYSISKTLNLDLRGTASSPIWIVAKEGERVVITRPDARQNVMNLGTKKTPASYVVLKDLEITGGSQGLRFFLAAHVWIDRCHIHHVGGVGIAANTGTTTGMFITRNEIHSTAGTGEGMYLGANHGAHPMSHSLVARNWVHHTAGHQGDGIEIKQGSWNNRVVENVVHDTPFPSIILYGTGGKEHNVVERNVCWASGDNIMQIQGECIVRNNLMMQGNIGFHSHDHQGDTRDLVVVHNTIINARDATDLYSWNGREGMVFANNAVYSGAGLGISFPQGSERVDVRGNVIFGVAAGVEGGFRRTERGLNDFFSMAWRGPERDARPHPKGALPLAGVSGLGVTDDMRGRPRRDPPTPGCFEFDPDEEP